MAAISVRPLYEADLAAVGRIVPLAFGTFLGHAPDAAQLAAEADTNTAAVRARWRADPAAAFVAEADGQLAGSIFATHWGSVGFFGPLTVHPDWWDRGVAHHLLQPVMDLFARWGVTQAGLFTFAQSTKHLHLYQHFGFWPRYLTAIMRQPVAASAVPVSVAEWSRLSARPAGTRTADLAACRELTDSLFPGLDLTRDIRAVRTLHLGDTILLWDESQLVGLAVCHWGAGSEADRDVCYVKFGAVRSGPHAAQTFARLLDACAALTAEVGMATLEVGVNTARHEAYRALLTRGFRTSFQGVALHRPNEPGYSQPGSYVLDDWR